MSYIVHPRVPKSVQADKGDLQISRLYQSESKEKAESIAQVLDQLREGITLAQWAASSQFSPFGDADALQACISDPFILAHWQEIAKNRPSSFEVSEIVEDSAEDRSEGSVEDASEGSDEE